MSARAGRRLFWSAVWLAVALVAIKAPRLGGFRMPGWDGLLDYVRSLAAITYGDVLFSGGWWVAGCVALALVGERRLAVRFLSIAFLVLPGLCLAYATANVLMFAVFGGFVTYPLLALLGDVRMLRSSVEAYLTPRAMAGFLAVPAAYVMALAATLRFTPTGAIVRRVRVAVVVGFVLWCGVGYRTFVREWPGRQDRRIAANAPWVFVSSWWQALDGRGVVRMPGHFPEGDLTDFDPLPSPQPEQVRSAIRRASAALGGRVTASRRPPNVILVVLESVAARWTSLDGGGYATTPTLAAESSRSVVFDNAYAHIGRSSNSLVAMLLSAYPKLDFREITEQFPDHPGTSLAEVFRARGYRTAFMTPSDLRWARWNDFLDGRGFDDVSDYRGLATCPNLLSSWGVEDRCLVDGMVTFVEREREKPFFLMAWTTQTHHPYDMSPHVAELNLLRERTPDDWELGRYLNILHETDRQLARIFDVVRRSGLGDDTLVVVVGDHGQAFGYPHRNTFLQGRTVYEEDVSVPLMFWFPRAYRSAVRSHTVAGHVDLAPTIAALAGVPAAPDWQGRSLFDARQPHRAYFYVAEDSFTLGVREDNWKYIFDLRDGTEELYDLDRDPTEQHNLAAGEAGRCSRLRQRLAAWTEANRRQYERIAGMEQTASVPPRAP